MAYLLYAGWFWVNSEKKCLSFKAEHMLYRKRRVFTSRAAYQTTVIFFTGKAIGAQTGVIFEHLNIFEHVLNIVYFNLNFLFYFTNC